MYTCNWCGELQWPKTPLLLVTTKVFKAIYPPQPIKRKKRKFGKAGEGTLIAQQKPCCPKCAEKAQAVGPEVVGTKVMTTKMHPVDAVDTEPDNERKRQAREYKVWEKEDDGNATGDQMHLLRHRS